ncbi:MAG: hypothetical protein HW392_1405 [Steroidobacteraceae bacterium]|nr:hypothetical protein [Steroidobacteraceae bacterium]
MGCPLTRPYPLSNMCSGAGRVGLDFISNVVVMENHDAAYVSWHLASDRADIAPQTRRVLKASARA